MFEQCGNQPIDVISKYHKLIIHTAKHAVSEGTKAVTKFESASSN